MIFHQKSFKKSFMSGDKSWGRSGNWKQTIFFLGLSTGIIVCFNFVSDNGRLKKKNFMICGIYFLCFCRLCKQRPDALTEEMIVAFVKPDVVEELGRIGSFENKKRISVKGEVTKVSLIFSHFLLMARLSEIKKKNNERYFCDGFVV